MIGDPWAWAYAVIPLAYEAGRAAGVEALAEALAEVDAARSLMPDRWASNEEVVAERVAELEECAAIERRAHGTRPWPGKDSMLPAQWEASMAWLLATWDRPTGRETRHGRTSVGPARP